MANTLNDNPLNVLKLDVYSGHLVCQVQFAPSVSHQTTPALIEHVLKRFPNLPYHACVNECANTFGPVMNKTPLPHLLEHIIVDIQTKEQMKKKDVHSVHMSESLTTLVSGIIVGTSEWIDENVGTARIDVSFTNDLIALAALKTAVEFLNAILRKQVKHS